MKQNNNETKMGTPSVILFFLVKKIFLTERFNVPLFEYEFQHDFNDE